jgi:hypothetical protein
MRPEVVHTECFERIAALPRRHISADDADAWAQVLTPMLRRPGSDAELLRWQGFGLAEATENQGAWFGYAVGAGKTLLFELMPKMMKSTNAILVIPAGLRDKTFHERGLYNKDWDIGKPAAIVTLEKLAPEGGAYLLDQIQPDLILLDEFDELANRKSSAARRLDRYITSNRKKFPPGHPRRVRVVAATGTPMRKTIMGWWHIIQWTHGYFDGGAPLPHKESEVLTWAAAVDETGPRGGRRPRPGPLGADLMAARAWLNGRLKETPGVVIVDEDSCDAPLTVRVRLAKEDPIIDEHFDRFLVEQENPAGIPVSDPLSRWRLDGQLGCGLYLEWDPPPPEYWRTARRSVAYFVRKTIDESTRTSAPLDTEAQVLRRHEGYPLVQEWQAVRHDFVPNTKAVWLSDSVIETAREWLAESDEPGIVWCGSVDFAERLAEVTGLPYYSRKGKDQNGRGLHAADPTRSMVASWHANKKGHNLQAWCRQLLVMPPQSAKWIEQIFGRSHRAGQDGHVFVDILATSGGTLDGFDAALREAGTSKSIVSLTQKVLRATIKREKPTITDSNQFRWARRDN